MPTKNVENRFHQAGSDNLRASKKPLTRPIKANNANKKISIFFFIIRFHRSRNITDLFPRALSITSCPGEKSTKCHAMLEDEDAARAWTPQQSFAGRRSAVVAAGYRS